MFFFVKNTFDKISEKSEIFILPSAINTYIETNIIILTLLNLEIKAKNMSAVCIRNRRKYNICHNKLLL